jgi:hypothetical protein
MFDLSAQHRDIFVIDFCREKRRPTAYPDRPVTVDKTPALARYPEKHRGP